ncbi:MAG: NADH-quinone oxidoreductase subunit NuoE [Anaerolineae bacterium]|jgi:NADH-quinone oxidoreductase subunit E|nr:NADH-quinone oxidoreductase subunit NuoE [Anaerolineae bacterium]MDH7474513.1 NADH-quinone oxidoreductase subunit NuoE [Anaerolineae bacterium]
MTNTEAVLEQETLDLAPLYGVLNKYRHEKGAVIPVLQQAQEIYGWLPAEVLQAIAKGLRVPLSQVYGVVTFYSQFYLTRRGRHIIRECDGTACHVRGAARIISTVEKELGIKAGQTTPDYRLSYEVVYCLGSCGLAPVAMVDNEVVGHLVPEKMLQIVRELD